MSDDCHEVEGKDIMSVKNGGEGWLQSCNDEAQAVDFIGPRRLPDQLDALINETYGGFSAAVTHQAVQAIALHIPK